MPNWFPGTYYARFARENQKYIKAMLDVPFERVRRNVVRDYSPLLMFNFELASFSKTSGSTDDHSSFLSKHLRAHASEGDQYRFQLEDIKGAAAIMYAGGSETVCLSSLQNPCISLSLHIYVLDIIHPINLYLRDADAS
jgi:hypothetical protein